MQRTVHDAQPGHRTCHAASSHAGDAGNPSRQAARGTSDTTTTTEASHADQNTRPATDQQPDDPRTPNPQGEGAKRENVSTAGESSRPKK